MKTAQDVIDRIDAAIEVMEAEAGKSAIEALTDYGDREAYHDALKAAHSLNAIRDLRHALAEEVEPTAEEVVAETATPRGPNELRQAIRDKMKKHGHSQQWAAAYMGVSRQTLSGWLAQRRRVSAATLGLIRGYLGYAGAN